MVGFERKVNMDTLPLGQTATLEPRVYTVNSLIKLPAGTNWKGTPGKTIINNPFQDSGKSSFNIKESDILLDGITFNCGTIYVDRPGGPSNDNISANNCMFNLQGGPGFTFTSQVKNLNFTNCGFTGMGHGFGIYAASGNNAWSKFIIANNEFVNMSAGFHITNGGPGLLVEENYLYGLKGQGMEIQGVVIAPIIRRNWADHPYWQDHANDDGASNGDTYHFTIPMAGSTDAQVYENVAIAPSGGDVGHHPASKNFTRIMFELGGTRLKFFRNYVSGGNDLRVNGYGATGDAYENHIEGLDHGPGNNGNNHATVIWRDNNVNLALKSLLLGRGKPGRNRRLDLGTTPTPVPDPTPVPPDANAQLAQALIDLSNARTALVAAQVNDVADAQTIKRLTDKINAGLAALQ